MDYTIFSVMILLHHVYNVTVLTHGGTSVYSLIRSALGLLTHSVRHGCFLLSSSAVVKWSLHFTNPLSAQAWKPVSRNHNIVDTLRKKKNLLNRVVDHGIKLTKTSASTRSWPGRKDKASAALWTCWLLFPTPRYFMVTSKQTTASIHHWHTSAPCQCKFQLYPLCIALKSILLFSVGTSDSRKCTRLFSLLEASACFDSRFRTYQSKSTPTEQKWFMPPRRK